MKPTLPKGTRDFSSQQVIKREYIFSIIKRVFKQYGYAPIETPAMEALQTLMGKYGEEGDKLLFKVLNNGDFLKKADQQAIQDGNSDKAAPSLSKRGLRYDLTVPFARYVVMHQNDLQFPFKRYQIQPVWRADRPQKGRYQEFYQCDADVIGSGALIYEAEFLQIFDQVFEQLNLSVNVRYNHRQILLGVAEYAGIADQFVDMTVCLDKRDKIGDQGVLQELSYRGISDAAAQKVIDVVSMEDAAAFAELIKTTEAGSKGYEEIERIHQFLNEYQPTNTFTLDPTLARGLSYYTGCIFEVESLETQMGSIAAGGRYADLTSLFGMPNMSGVGISFGAERIFDVMETLERFPESLSTTLDAIILPMDDTALVHGFSLASALRKAGKHVDVYPKPAKMQKQMKYANARQIPHVIIIGTEEVASGMYTLKNMLTGEQQKTSAADLHSSI